MLWGTLCITKPPRMCMPVHPHELKDVPVALDAALEGRAALVRSESHRCDQATGIVNRNNQATPDSELCRFVKKVVLRP